MRPKLLVVKKTMTAFTNIGGESESIVSLCSSNKYFTHFHNENLLWEDSNSFSYYLQHP